MSKFLKLVLFSLSFPLHTPLYAYDDLSYLQNALDGKVFQNQKRASFQQFEMKITSASNKTGTITLAISEMEQVNCEVGFALKTNLVDEKQHFSLFSDQKISQRTLQESLSSREQSILNDTMTTDQENTHVVSELQEQLSEDAIAAEKLLSIPVQRYHFRIVSMNKCKKSSREWYIQAGDQTEEADMNLREIESLRDYLSDIILEINAGIPRKILLLNPYHLKHFGPPTVDSDFWLSA